jgi:hypothetical protein
MAGPLLMASKDHFNILLLMKDVENFQDDSTRKRKNCLDAFPFETLDEYLSTCELHDNASIRTTNENLAEKS